MQYKYLVASALQEELNSFLQKLNPEQRHLPSGVVLSYYEHHGKKIEVLAYSADKMGMPYNAAKLMQIIMMYRPRYILYIGICAGLKLHPLGTVLIPKKVFSYESGKLEKGKFLPDYNSYDTSEFLRKCASDLNDKDFNSFGYKVTTDEDFSSGSAVINDEGKVTEIIEKGARKLSGLEMEAYSVACINDILKPASEALVIKGISDRAVNKDDSEIDGSRDLAKRNAADFALRLISYMEERRVTVDLHYLSVETDISEDPKATFPLKLNFRVLNKASTSVQIESIRFDFLNNSYIDPKTRRPHLKPLFLVGKNLEQKDMYTDMCILKPGEATIACWIPLNLSIGKLEMKKLNASRKIGKWVLNCRLLDSIAYEASLFF